MKKKFLLLAIISSCLFVGKVNAEQVPLELTVGESKLIKADASADVNSICTRTDSSSTNREYFSIINIGDNTCLITGKKATTSALTETTFNSADTSGTSYSVTVAAKTYDKTSIGVNSIVNIINTETTYKDVIKTALATNWNTYWHAYNTSANASTVFGTSTFDIDAAYYYPYTSIAGAAGNFYIRFGFEQKYIVLNYTFAGSVADPFLKLECVTGYGADYIAKELYFYVMEASDRYDEAKSLITTQDQMISFLASNSQFGSYTLNGTDFTSIVYLDASINSTIIEKLTPSSNDDNNNNDNNNNNNNNNQNNQNTNPNTGASITFVIFMVLMLVFIGLLTRANKKIYKI